MKLEPVGVKTAEEKAQLESVTVPVVAYSTDDGSEIITDINFLPHPPPQASLTLVDLAGNPDELTPRQIEEWLQACLHPKSVESWRWLTSTNELNLDYETVVAVYMSLIAQYSGRPTKKRPPSRSITPPTRRTTAGASRSKASTSRGSK